MMNMERALLCIVAASALSALCSLPARKYYFVHELKNWTEARRFCRAKYSDLATIRNMEDVMMLNDLLDLSQLGDDYRPWIGLYDDVNSWRWSMSDSDFYQHDEETFRNWKHGEPNNCYGKENCAEMYNDGSWNDECCSQTQHSICFDVRGENVTFVRINIKLNWTEAQRYCREHHTDLASVRNKTENQKMKEMVSTGGSLWIGLSRKSWKWSDGTSSAFRFWWSGEPNSKKGNCAAANMRKSGKWENWNCREHKSVICSADVATMKQVKLKVLRRSSVDLNSSDVLEDLLEKMKLKLRDQGMNGDIRLSWRKQEDGNIFHKDGEKPKKKKNDEL